VGNYYRPLMNLEFLLCFKLFGSSPYGFHLINILLHCIVVWLVYAVTVALVSGEVSGETFGLIAAACFALHPIHTEPVTWIDGVADLEMSIFYLLAFWLFLRLGREETRRGIWVQLGMCGSFLLATMSKEPAITLPAVATIYEHFFRTDRGSTSWQKKLSRYGGFWATGLAYLVIRGIVLGGFAPVPLHTEIGLREAMLTGVALLGQYAAKLLWPVPLVAFYPFQRIESFLDSRVLLGAEVLLAAGAFVAYDRKRARVYTFALFWILLTLGPALNVRWMLVNVFAERYLYLPSVGFCWLVAGAALWCWRKTGSRVRERRRALGIAAGIVCLLAAGEIVARNRDWKDDRSIALSTLQARPDSSGMRSDVGMADWHDGNHAEAIRQWRLALAYHPDTPEALSNLGFAMLEEKRYVEAMPFLQRAIELRPHFAIPHVYLARVYEGQGKNTEAEAEFRRAAEIYPMNPLVRNALGSFYLEVGRAQEAESEFLASVAIVANYEGWSGLSEAYTLQNAPDKAEEAWRQVLALEPYDSHAHLSLGRIYLAKGRSTEAEEEFESCLYTDPNNAEALAAVQKLRPQEKRPAVP
jgi:tetratricopeptide (TPR) repeat protein